MDAVDRRAVIEVEAAIVLSLARQAGVQGCPLRQDDTTGLYEVRQSVDAHELAIAAINALPSLESVDALVKAARELSAHCPLYEGASYAAVSLDRVATLKAALSAFDKE